MHKIEQIKEKYAITYKYIAELMRIDVSTLRRWKAGTRKMSASHEKLLDIVDEQLHDKQYHKKPVRHIRHYT